MDTGCFGVVFGIVTASSARTAVNMPSAPLDLAELELPTLEAALQADGFETYHARQLFRWIYKRGIVDVERMTDLSRGLRNRLQSAFMLATPRVVGDQRSTDGTRKFVL